MTLFRSAGGVDGAEHELQAGALVLEVDGEPAALVAAQAGPRPRAPVLVALEPVPHPGLHDALALLQLQHELPDVLYTLIPTPRSEGPRVGKDCGRPVRTRW